MFVPGVRYMFKRVAALCPMPVQLCSTYSPPRALETDKLDKGAHLDATRHQRSQTDIMGGSPHRDAIANQTLEAHE
eukprot:9001837-Pyramimonas_sp.AAC.1